MGLNTYCCRREDSFDRDEGKRQRTDGDGGRALKVPLTEKASRERMVPPTASKLEAVLVPRKRSWEGKGGGGKRIVDGFAVYKERKAFSLARDAVNGAAAKVNWRGVDVLDYIDLQKYLNSKRFGVISVNGCVFCINTKGLNRLTVNGAFNQ